MISLMKSATMVAGLSLVAWGLVPSPANAGPYALGWDEEPPVGNGQPAVPAVLPLGAGVGVVSPYQRVGPRAYVRVPHYQGPDGSYDSLVDLTREINGIPCGIYCQDRALRRWGYVPAY